MNIGMRCMVGLSLALCAGGATADVVDFMSDSSSTTNSSWTGAEVTGSIEYNYTSGNQGVLTFSVSNTSDSSVGGFLTGLVFNIDSADSGASATLSSTTDSDFQNTGTEAANPFGTFDAGAALNANWTGGGNPSRGLAIGSSLTLVFSVMASDASSLSAMSFLGDGDDIALRFRGLNNNASDKLLGMEDPELNVVPLPAPVLAGGAMLGLGLGVRRFRAGK